MSGRPDAERTERILEELLQSFCDTADIARRANWLLGDIAREVEDRFGPGALSELAAAGQMTLRWVRELARVARAFPEEVRQELSPLSWQVFRVCASAPDPVALAREAADKHLSARQVRRMLEPAPARSDRRPIVAVDFDGVIVENRFPEIGPARGEVLEALRRWKRAGCRIVVWTCRAGEHLEAARAWLDEKGVPYDAINENVPDLGFETGRKIYADVYLDDRAAASLLAAEDHLFPGGLPREAGP